MINIKRPDCPDILKVGLDSESDGEWETKDAIEFYTDTKNHQEKYKRTGKRGNRTKQDYVVYKESTVRDVLTEMFHGKCAYCESKITAIYSGDIEHFRPKGKIQEASPSKPGYFWLASEWENLLFACPYCNQTHTHKVNNGGVLEEAVFGKLDQFPLSTERYRLNHSHGLIYFSNKNLYSQLFNLEESERLLLNPCKDDNIEKYFKYDDKGAIISNDGLTLIEEQKAQRSILTYALHRLSLNIEREERIIEIKAQIRRVEMAIENYNNNLSATNEIKVRFEEVMRDEMEVLKKFKDSDQKYAGLARYIIHKYFDEANFL